jgi:hypothetical protein
MVDHKDKLRADELPAIEISSLDSSNLSFFSTFIPPELLSELQDGVLFALGAISEGTACAALVAELDDTECRLRSIFVAPDYRR